jgi:hypothetical protein
MVILLAGCKGTEGPTESPEIPSHPVDTLKPKITFTYPPMNSQGPYSGFYPANNSIIKIAFNKTMNSASVRRAVAITSPRGNIRADTNMVITTDGYVFFITPVDSSGHLLSRWWIGENYTFTIASSAHDTSGNALQPAFTMNFMPEPLFRIPGATNLLQKNSPFFINFNSLVDTSIFSAIKIAPQVTGYWYISVDSMSACAYPLNVQANETTYTVIVTTDAHDKYDNHLSTAVTFPFTTVAAPTPFTIVTAIPQNTSSSLFPNIYIGCSLLVDTGTIRSAFHIKPNILGQFIFGDVYFYFNPSRDYFPETTYIVTIDTTLREEGGTGLSAQYVFSFKTPPFEVQSTLPADSQTAVDTASDISVEFDAMIDDDSVPTSFSLVNLSNAVVVQGSYIYNPNAFFFEPAQPLYANTNYRATISTGLRTREGVALKSPYTFSFKTGN